MPRKNNWGQWNDERAAFTARDTEGFSHDLKALGNHIKSLTVAAPKDAAGWPNTNALKVINQLRQDYIRFKAYQNLNSQPADTPQD